MKPRGHKPPTAANASLKYHNDPTRVNVLAYAAWLLAMWYVRHCQQATGEGLTGYDALRVSAAGACEPRTARSVAHPQTKNRSR